MARRFDCRRVKIHRTYKIAELAALLGVHKKTIGRWIAAGLPAMGAKRSRLVHGEDLRAFMNARKPIKQRRQPGDIWCLGCRGFKRPALNMAEYSPRTMLRGHAERHLSRLRTDDLPARRRSANFSRIAADSTSHFRRRSNA